MRSSLRQRLLLGFLIPAAVFFAIAGMVSYGVSRNILEEELGKSLSAMAASASTQVRGGLLLEIEPGDEVGDGTLTYRNLLRRLSDVQQATKARRVFAFDLEGRMRVDSLQRLPVGTEIPELLRDRLELQRVFLGQTAASQVLFVGSDDRMYKTGYAPIFRDNVVVGALGIEGSAEFFGPLVRLSQTFAMWSLLSLGFLTLAAWWVSKAVSAPLHRLVESALRIGAGDLKTQVPKESLREVGLLATELETMRAALLSRDEQLKMMLAGVAHEVRNPIGGIELFAGVLAEEVLSEEMKTHVEHIRKETAYLKQIVEDFLAFAKERDLVLESHNIIDVLELATSWLQNDAQKKKVRLQVDAHPARLNLDKPLFLSALVNVVKNAIQAAPEGSEVQLLGRKTNERYVLEIVDHGAGIPRELQARIFEPFFTTREKGTGLGLPLSMKVVHAHQGHLSVVSRPQETRFIFDMPTALPPRQ